MNSSSFDFLRGRHRQPHTLGIPRSRHRSKSIRRSDRWPPQRAAILRCDTCLKVLYTGHVVSVFSRSADAWVDGEVVNCFESNAVWVEYEIGANWFGKKLSLHSKTIHIPCDCDGRSGERALGAIGIPAIVLAPSAKQLPRNKHFQGNRDALPLECRGDPANYFINTGYIWTLLERQSVVLVKASWLIEHANARPLVQLPCRQDLPRHAYTDVQQLRLLGEGIVAISHCWLSSDHPDPDGTLLNDIAPLLNIKLNDFREFWMSENLDLKDPDVGVFLAWCSLYQPYHINVDGRYRRLEDSLLTPEQSRSHQKSLEAMDIWYANQEIEVWKVTKYYPGQGEAYENRGWPTWEQSVADLLHYSSTVLDLGRLDLKSRDSILIVGADACTFHDIAPREFGLEHLDWIDIVELCASSRSPPRLPQDFAKWINGKTFTCGPIDCEKVTENYFRNFVHAAKCAQLLDFKHSSWDDDELEILCRALAWYTNLVQLELDYNYIGDAGACALAAALPTCETLEQVSITHNIICDAGACALASQLPLCKSLKFFDMAANDISSDCDGMLEVLAGCGVLSSRSGKPLRATAQDLAVRKMKHAGKLVQRLSSLAVDHDASQQLTSDFDHLRSDIIQRASIRTRAEQGLDSKHCRYEPALGQ